MTGRSATIDPLHDAVRGDLADVRLAERVFAPHYVMAAARVVAQEAQLRESSSDSSPSLTRLDAGMRFDLLDVTGSTAWGIAQPSGLVGYVPADALAPATPATTA